jgi:hypothetical protein
MMTKNICQTLAIFKAISIRGCNGGASPNGAHPLLHVKPLDAAIRQMLTLYCPGAATVDDFEMKKNKTKHNF